MKRILLLLAITSFAVVSCKKKEGCTDPSASNYDQDAEKDDSSCEEDHDHDHVEVPSTYVFKDDAGNSTVSFGGQQQRLEMLSEITKYLKTANTAGTSLDATQLKNMFANSGYTWIDTPGLGMTGSTKQLKNKTAGGDAVITALFEYYMDSIAVLSASTVAGTNAGGPGVGGVVESGPADKGPYLMTAKGVEYTQWIEKGLMGAVFYYQIMNVYLGESKMGDATGAGIDNTTAVDAINGKYYTVMEHHWDEAFGYFTDAVDYPENGTDRFWGKYTNGRDGLLGSNSKIMDAFLKGRTAIVNKDMTERNTQIAIIKTELEKVCAATAIHYINSALSSITINTNRNHSLSEATAFLSDLKYGKEDVITRSKVETLIATIGSDFYNVDATDLNNVKNELSTLFGFDNIKNEL